MKKQIKFKVTTADADGSNEVTREVSAGFADLARYDILRNRFGFPKQEDAPVLFMGLLAYCNLVRTGQIPATTKPELFVDSVLDVEEMEEVGSEDSKSGAAE